jgi:probable rRNA maturation factor
MAVNRHKPLMIEIQAAGWETLKGLEKRLNEAALLTLSVLPQTLLPSAARAQMTLLLTSDKKVQALNRDFRGKDKPTNVLSFPQFDRKELFKAGKEGGLAAKTPLYVGDIAVAYGTVLKEAKAAGKPVTDHLTHLLIHGLLHLFGYDHDTDSKATRMERLEKEVMATLGLPDPYVVFVASEKQRGSVKRKK